MVVKIEKKWHPARLIAVGFAVLILAAGCSGREGGSRVREAEFTGEPVNDFIAALHIGDTEKIESLVAENPSLLELRDEVGQTPMHYAALENQPGVLKLLAEKGMDPNVRDDEGRTPLTVLEDSGLRYDTMREMLIELGGKN